MWNLSYLVQIKNPLNHYVHVQLTLTLNEIYDPKLSELEVFIPSWSPGSYLMREYARHLRCLKVTNATGVHLNVFPKSKSSWLISWNQEDFNFNNQNEKIIISYEVYCHEISVRTSYIDQSHAFLHGPTYLMGLVGNQAEPTIEFRIPPAWSKISTALREESGVKRDQLIFRAKDYDELLDCPVEIGCHETDGFMLNDVSYHLAVYGANFPIPYNLKNDIKKICETINEYMGDVPFKQYNFIIHFLPQTYGGLEHSNSTVLMFDGRKLASKKEYQSFLSLIAHEYFHVWNVKRIRPKELGPFDYQNEAYTNMLWLAEGLTKFMDDYLVYKSGLMSLEDYCDFIKSDMNSYYKTPGRKYDSLENSSFGAWIKLYRPHENIHNSTISYYLKGGLVFFVFHLDLAKKGLSIKTLIDKLWSSYKLNPNAGLTKESFLDILKNCGYPNSITEVFEDYLVTTKEINFPSHFENTGMELVFEKSKPSLGMEVEFKGEQIYVKTVIEDGASHRAGLNAQDEILFVNSQRLLRSDWNWFQDQLQENITYEFIVSRNGYITKIELMSSMSTVQISSIKITDKNKVHQLLS